MILMVGLLDRMHKYSADNHKVFLNNGILYVRKNGQDVAAYTDWKFWRVMDET